jgi:hypothetical protein
MPVANPRDLMSGKIILEESLEFCPTLLGGTNSSSKDDKVGL